MPDKEIHIEEIILRVPEMKQNEAHIMAKKALREVADKMPLSVQEKKVNAIELSVKVAPDVSTTSMAQSIAKTILNSLL